MLYREVAVMWLLAILGCADPASLALRIDVLTPDERWLACGGERALAAPWDDELADMASCDVQPGASTLGVAGRWPVDAPRATWTWWVDGERIDVDPPDWQRHGALDDGLATWVTQTPVPDVNGAELAVALKADGQATAPVDLRMNPPVLSVVAMSGRPRQAGVGQETFLVVAEPSPRPDVQVTLQSFVDGREVGRPLPLPLDVFGNVRGVLQVPWTVGEWTVRATGLDQEAWTRPIDVALRGPLQMALLEEPPEAITAELVRDAPPLERAVVETAACAEVFLVAHHDDPPPDPVFDLSTGIPLVLGSDGTDWTTLDLGSGDLVIDATHAELPSSQVVLTRSPMHPSAGSALAWTGEELVVDDRGTPLSGFRVLALERDDLPPLSGFGGDMEFAVVMRPEGVDGPLPCGDPVPDANVACDALDAVPDVDGDCWLMQEPPPPAAGEHDVPLAPGICWAGTVGVELWARMWTATTGRCVADWPLSPWTLLDDVTIVYAAP